MKKKAVILKNCSVVLMLVALLCFMLPVCKVTVLEQGTTKLSGYELVTITAGAAREYIQEGIITEDYVLTNGLTFGMVVDEMEPFTEGNQLGHLALIMIILILPGGCCLFAMIATIKADKIKEMTLPMILLGISILEMTGLIALFLQSCSMIKKCVKLQPSVGIYVCMNLCILALIILVILRMTEGFPNITDKKRKNE